MSKITITEALAEIRTIEKRLQKKREFILQFLHRQEALKDPLVQNGGSVKAIERERQAIGDLEERIVTIRRAVSIQNEETEVVVANISRSIADWLVWRRDVAPGQQQFLVTLIQNLNQTRREAMQKGLAVVTTADSATRPQDVVVNISEQELASMLKEYHSLRGF